MAFIIYVISKLNNRQKIRIVSEEVAGSFQNVPLTFHANSDQYKCVAEMFNFKHKCSLLGAGAFCSCITVYFLAV